jgi:tetratricopeptide (TPR) repeat protein
MQETRQNYFVEQFELTFFYTFSNFMATNKQFTKKQNEDTLVDISQVTANAQHWFERYQKPITYAVAGLAVIILGYFGYKNFILEPKQQAANTALFRAEMQFERDSFNAALTNPGGGYDGFLTIISKYSGTPVANLAKYYAGVSYLNLGKFDEAIKYLNDFSPVGKVSPTMKYGSLGDAYSEKKDFKKALELYKQAGAAGEVDDLKAYYYKKAGRLAQFQNDFVTALECFKKIKTDLPLAPDARDIDKYITFVEAKMKK